MVIVRKEQWACLSLLVLMVLPLESPIYFADGSARFNKFVSGPSSNKLHRNVEGYHHRFHQGFFKGSAEENCAGDGDTWVDDEKRRIHTGPNPLHNR